MPFDDDQRLVELVNLTADGLATPHQQAELQGLLDQSPDARALDASTRELVARLDSIEPAAPPAGLRPAVMSQLGGAAPATRVPRLLSRRLRFALAWAAAAGVILVVLLVSRPPRVGDHFAAVMAPAAEWPVLSTLRKDQDTLVIRQKADVFTLAPQISGPYPVTVSLSWDPAAATLVAHSGGPETSSSPDRAEFTLRSADDRVSVMIRRLGEDPFDVQMAVAGQEILRVEVPDGSVDQLF